MTRRRDQPDDPTVGPMALFARWALEKFATDKDALAFCRRVRREMRKPAAKPAEPPRIAKPEPSLLA